MNKESEYQKSYNRGKKMIERYLRTLGKEQALSRIKNVLVQLTSDEQIAKSKYNKGQIDALIDYVYGLNEGKIRLTESQLHKAIKESVYKVLNEISYGGTPKQRDPYDDRNRVNEILSKAKELIKMLQEVPFKKIGYSELASLQGDLYNQLSRFTTALNKVINKNRGNFSLY